MFGEGYFGWVQGEECGRPGQGQTVPAKKQTRKSTKLQLKERERTGKKNLPTHQSIYLSLPALFRKHIKDTWSQYSSVQFSRSVVSNSLRAHKSQHARPPCPYQLPEFTQTHVHRVSDAIQPSHPLLSPSPPAHNPSQNQSLPMSQLFA